MVDMLLYLTFLAGLFPAILFYSLKRASRSHIEYVKPFIWLTVVASVYEPVVTLWLGFASQNWFRLYNILEFLSLNYFFYKLLGIGYTWLQLSFLTIFFIGIPLLYFGADISQLKLETFYAPYLFVFVITCSVLWLRKIFIAADVQLHKSPAFCFVCAFFFYYTNTFFFHLLSEVVIMDYKHYYKQYWVINIVATLVFRLVISLGVWQGRRI